MHTFVKIGAVALALGFFGCGGNEPDPGLLDQYRAAIPSEKQLSASTPEASIQAVIGDPAMLPQGSKDIVLGVNGSVRIIVDTMKTIVATEPTVYNSDTKEFLWGPFDNGDGFGTVAAYIKDAGEGNDFRYHYALLRGTSKDVATMTPVIWGGANPDPGSDEHGSGVTLWDFEANYEFEKANNPAYDKLALERGRFVVVYGKDNNGKGDLGVVVAAMRGFVPKDKPLEAPADLDYFYGTFDDGTNRIDFVDWASAFDLDDDPAKPAAENIGVHMAFLNEGTGRGEAHASGGDLAADQTADLVECWDVALAQSYLSIQTSTAGTPDGAAVVDGDAAACGLFQKKLADLGIPSLADVDPALMKALDEVATNGVPQK